MFRERELIDRVGGCVYYAKNKQRIAVCAWVDSKPPFAD
jgi:hypothetical protein